MMLPAMEGDMTTVTAPRSRSSRTPSKRKSVDAATLAHNQREISVSEFFAKNRHLLGFDNPRKALLTSIKEAVDNALDACEEAGILPELFVGIEPISETRFRVTVRDNGPGIVKGQVGNIFGKLLYGSKFHRLKMSRGQQGIGISAAGMYGLMTTGKPMVIHTKPRKNKPCHKITVAMDTQKNRPEIKDEEEHHAFEHPTGTEVNIELEAKYNRGKQSVDEFLEQTAIANPHARIIYQPPTACRTANGQDDDENLPTLIDDYEHARKLADKAAGTATTPGGTIVYPRGVSELPEEPKEIKPHPYGIELGTLIKMLRDNEGQSLNQFLTGQFCKVSSRIAQDLAEQSGMTSRTRVTGITHHQAEALYKAIQETKLQSPPTNCLSPIGTRQILAGLLKGLKAEFFTATTRKPTVYRGNPFQIEVGMAYGGDLPADQLGRVIRFANRVPLLYQQSSCCAYKAVLETTWRNYGLQQSRGALPTGPLVVMIHMASVWVPFTSESKEAIADYDEIRKEIKLALGECGRKLNTYVRRRQRIKRESERRSVFEKYIGEVVTALNAIDKSLKKTELKQRFEAVAKRITLEADTQFDEDGNPIKAGANGNGSLDRDESTVILGEGESPPSLDTPATKGKRKTKAKGGSRTKMASQKTRTKNHIDDDGQYELYAS